MKQEIRIIEDFFYEDVFHVEHTLPFTKPLVVHYDRKTKKLYISEEKELIGKERSWQFTHGTE